MSILTAELCARAIIAAAVSMGDLPVLRLGQFAVQPRHLRPAAVAIALEVKRPLTDICRILEIQAAAVAADRSADKEAFGKAQRAAREAIACHLKVKAERAAALAAAQDGELLVPAGPQACAEPGPEPAPQIVEAVVAVEPPPPVEIIEQPEPTVSQPAPRPAPSRPAPKAAAKPAQPSRRERAMPKGARFVNLGEGVTRIEMKPISERVARMAQQQLARPGADLNFIAECFDVDADALQSAITALAEGEAA